MPFILSPLFLRRQRRARPHRAELDSDLVYYVSLCNETIYIGSSYIPGGEPGMTFTHRLPTDYPPTTHRLLAREQVCARASQHAQCVQGEPSMTVERSHTFAYLLKHHRSAAGLTQEELAGRAGVGARTISNLERGISRAPYRATVRRLADALGLSGEDLTQFAASARCPLNLKHSSSGGRMAVEGGFLGALPAAHLVAREQELGRVLDTLKAAEGGSGRLVLLTGEPGIGKTRLAQEASVRAREGVFVVASGRCY